MVSLHWSTVPRFLHDVAPPPRPRAHLLASPIGRHHDPPLGAPTAAAAAAASSRIIIISSRTTNIIISCISSGGNNKNEERASSFENDSHDDGPLRFRDGDAHCPASPTVDAAIVSPY